MRTFSTYLSELKNEHIAAKYNLGGSTPPVLGSWKRVRIKASTLEFSKTSEYRFFIRTLGRMLAARESEIALAPGSSQVMFQTLAALTQPGDRIVLETPVYEPFVAAARFLGLKIQFFKRTGEFDTDLTAARAKCRGRNVKLILLSNPHCPTGHMYSARELAEFSKLGPRLVVDEVFLPLFANGNVTSVRNRGIISIGSLSKSLGLGNLRLGWVRADAKTILRIKRIGYDLHIEMPTASVQLGAEALRQWKPMLRHNLKVADRNRQLVHAFAAKHPGLIPHGFQRGYFFVLKIPSRFKSGRKFAATLLKKSIWPRAGESFSMPGYVRLHVLLPPKDFAKVFREITLHY